MQVNISTSEQSIQENLSHLLERLSGCGNPKVSSLKLFWEETEGGVLLILLWVEIVAMRTSVQSESELDYLKHQHKVNLPLPILSLGKCEFETNMGEHLEESCWVFCASLDGEGGVVFL